LTAQSEEESDSEENEPEREAVRALYLSGHISMYAVFIFMLLVLFYRAHISMCAIFFYFHVARPAEDAHVISAR
jgi:hypothetical protein